MTELFINDEQLELYPNAGVGITYSVGSVLNLNFRSGYYTNKFNIPKTANNNAILGFLFSANSESEFPYQQNKVDMYVDGVAVILQGTAVVEESSEDYVVYVTSGNVDFFDLLKNVTIADLDLSDYDHVSTVANFGTYRTNTSGVIYPLIESGIDEPCVENENQPTVGNFVQRVYNGRIFPAMYVKTILERIETYTDYQIKGNFLDTTFYDKAVLLANNFYKEIDETKQRMLRVNSDSTFFTSASRSYGSAYTAEKVATQIAFNDDDFVIPLTTTVFQPDKLVTYKVEIKLELTWRVPLGNGGVTKLEFAIAECNSGGTYIGVADFYTEDEKTVWNELKTGTVPVLTDVDISYEAEYYVQVDGASSPQKYFRPYLIETIDAQGTTGSFQSQLTIKDGSSLTFSELEAIYPNENVDMNLCFTQKATDVMKDIIKMQNLIVQTDNIEKSLNLNVFDTLTDNIQSGNVIDWSDKVDLSYTPKISFVADGFAQSNKFTYKNDDSLRSGYLSIDNLNIQTEATVVTLSSTAVESEYSYDNALGVTYYMPKTPLVNPDLISLQPLKGGDTYFLLMDIKNAANHTIHVQNVTTSTVGTITDNAIYSLNLPFAYFYDASQVDSLDWTNLLEQNYKVNERIFDKLKEVHLYFMLTSSDISVIDFSIPIYLDIPNIKGFFYLNKIENFKEKKSIKCELIRL